MFHVVMIHDDGGESFVERDMSARDALRLAVITARDVSRPGPKGDCVRILITDDHQTLFAWEKGEAIVFPTPEQLRRQ